MGDRKFCYRCMEKYDMDQHVCPHCGFNETAPYNANYIAPGTILRDRYLIGVLLECNGEGATYIGHDLSTECNVLIREYMPVNFCTRVKNKATISVNYNNLAKYKAFMAEYTELNKSLARLRNNSNIDPILDMFADNNTTYTVFEYIDGKKMLDYLKDNAGEISWEQVSMLFPQLFTTIGILHNSGIIHRAISPETVFINSRGELKLLGFCISAVRTADTGLECELFKGYAAPEQYSASSRQGTWTDVYGVCALLYRCLTGCMPVDSMDRLKHDDLCEPSVLNQSIPSHVSKVIMEGLELSGNDRIQTITELVTRLFEQPVAPVKPVVHEQTYAHRQQESTHYEQKRENYQPYINENSRYYQVREENSKKHGEEKETMVEKLKVPVIIGVLLLAILLFIVVLLMPIFMPEKSNEDSSSSGTISESESSAEDVTSVPEEKPDTEVPNFVNKFFSLTKEKYADFFRFEAEYVYDNEHEADIILEQDVEPGTLVPQGKLINLKVSKGSEGANIPQYSGLTVSQYENELKKAGISNYSMVESGSSWGTPDTITQLQVDGKQVNPGEYFSNKDGKKLIVYYIPKDANVQSQPPQVEETQVQTQAPAPVTETPTVAPTEPPEPPTPAPTEPPVVQTDPPQEEPQTPTNGEIEVW